MRQTLLVRPVALCEACDAIVLARGGDIRVVDRGCGNGWDYCEGEREGEGEEVGEVGTHFCWL